MNWHMLQFWEPFHLDWINVSLFLITIVFWECLRKYNIKTDSKNNNKSGERKPIPPVGNLNE